MDLSELKMGDILTDGQKVLVVMETNKDRIKKFQVIWNNSCYYFEDTPTDLEHVKGYSKDISNNKYKVIGNMCNIMNKVIRDE